MAALNILNFYTKSFRQFSFNTLVLRYSRSVVMCYYFRHTSYNILDIKYNARRRKLFTLNVGITYPVMGFYANTIFAKLFSHDI